MFDNLFNARPTTGHATVSYGAVTPLTHDVKYVQAISSKPMTSGTPSSNTGCGCKSIPTGNSPISLNIFGRGSQAPVEEPVNKITVDYTTRLSKQITTISQYISTVTCDSDIKAIIVKLGLSLNEKLNTGYIFDEHCYKHVGNMTKSFVDSIAALTGFEEDLITEFVTKDLVDYPLPGEVTRITVPSKITSIATFDTKFNIDDGIDPLLDLATGIAAVYSAKKTILDDGKAADDITKLMAAAKLAEEAERIAVDKFTELQKQVTLAESALHEAQLANKPDEEIAKLAEELTRIQGAAKKAENEAEEAKLAVDAARKAVEEARKETSGE